MGCGIFYGVLSISDHILKARVRVSSVLLRSNGHVSFRAQHNITAALNPTSLVLPIHKLIHSGKECLRACMQHLKVRAKTHCFTKHYRTMYSSCTHPLVQPKRVIFSQRIHLAPAHWYKHIESHTHCTSTLHPPYVTPSHIGSSTHCTSILHPPTGTIIQSDILTAHPPCTHPMLRPAI